jgi:hypothetical protein
VTKGFRKHAQVRIRCQCVIHSGVAPSCWQRNHHQNQSDTHGPIWYAEWDIWSLLGIKTPLQWATHPPGAAGLPGAAGAAGVGGDNVAAAVGAGGGAAEASGGDAAGTGRTEDASGVGGPPAPAGGATAAAGADAGAAAGAPDGAAALGTSGVIVSGGALLGSCDAMADDADDGPGAGGGAGGGGANWTALGYLPSLPGAGMACLGGGRGVPHLLDNWSYLACRTGHLVPIWQPTIGSLFHLWITTAACDPLCKRSGRPFASHCCDPLRVRSTNTNAKVGAGAEEARSGKAEGLQPIRYD